MNAGCIPYVYFSEVLLIEKHSLQLLGHGDVYGAYYLTPFVVWYAAISISF
jgi:hypothetical protein